MHYFFFMDCHLYLFTETLVFNVQLIKSKYLSFQIRLNTSLEVDPLENIPKEERGKVKETEINYV